MAKHEGKGGLWHNQYKSTGDTKPDYIGEITIAGVTHKIAAWHNKSGNPHQPLINMIVSQPKPIPAPVKDDWESNIPF